MNIMAQVPLEKKINMSYAAEELLVTCFFDGVSCDARSGEAAVLPALRTGPLVCPCSLAAGVGRERCSARRAYQLGGSSHGGSVRSQ